MAAKTSLTCSYCDGEWIIRFRFNGKLKRFCGHCLKIIAGAALSCVGEKTIEELLK